MWVCFNKHNNYDIFSVSIVLKCTNNAFNKFYIVRTVHVGMKLYPTIYAYKHWLHVASEWAPMTMIYGCCYVTARNL
jgi:hypothetical protein